MKHLTHKGQRQTLALMLAFFSLSSVVSCASAVETTPADTMDTASQKEARKEQPTETTEAADEITRPMHAVPVDTLDYNGATFATLAPELQSYVYYFFADEENGDVMNDALYHRKRIAEEALNVKITSEIMPYPLSNITSTVTTMVKAGDDTYQEVFLHCIEGVAQLSSGGYLLDLMKLPYIDIDAEWWNREQMEKLQLGKTMFYAVNDYMIPCPNVVYFSKEMVRRYDMDDPYTLVYDGKWTLDRMLAMAQEVTTDVNGDGVMDMEDQYGITANEISKYISFVIGSNQYITEKQSDGRIALAMNTEKMSDLVTRFANIAKNNVCFLNTEQNTFDISLDTGRMLFQLNTIASAEKMRGYTVDFGFLPYPKYDERQENYLSLDWGGLCCVPTTAANTDMIGAVMEILAYESKNEVIPTYYNTVLTGKLARDEDAVRMLDILFDTITYEIGGNYFGFDNGFTDLFYCLPRLAVKNQSTDFASWYKKNEKPAQKAIDTFYKNLEKNEASN